MRVRVSDSEAQGAEMSQTEPEDAELAEMRGVKVPGASEYIGGVGAALPFFIHYSASSSTTVNGVVTSSSFIDYVALAGGGIAVLFGIVSLALLGKTAPTKKSLRAALGGGLLLVGVFQLLRGLGYVAA